MTYCDRTVSIITKDIYLYKYSIALSQYVIKLGSRIICSNGRHSGCIGQLFVL